MKSYLILLLTSCIFACSSAVTNEVTGHSDNAEIKKTAINRLEKLYSLEIEDSAIKINVMSTGCTTVNDFKIMSTHLDNNCIVNILRIHPDLCKRAPTKIMLSLPWNKSQACDQSQIKVLNEVAETGGVLK